MANNIENTNPNDTQPTEIVVHGSHYTNAFLETAAERAALQPDQLTRVSFDVTLGVNLVLASIPRIEALKEDLAKLPLNQTQLTRLRLYAQAAGYAHALYVIAAAPPAELKAVYEDAVERRAALYSDAVNLARNGFVNGDSVNAISNEIGYRNVGYDLMALVALFREAVSRIQGRTATAIPDWETADLVAAKLLDLTAVRETRQQQQPKLADNRLRALTLMVKAFEHARRAVQFVRYEQGDAERIAPSIYTAKGVGPGKKQQTPPETPEGDSVAVLPGVIGPPAVIAPQVAPTAVEGSQHKAEVKVPDVPVGAPGGNPYM